MDNRLRVGALARWRAAVPGLLVSVTCALASAQTSPAPTPTPAPPPAVKAPPTPEAAGKPPAPPTGPAPSPAEVLQQAGAAMAANHLPEASALLDGLRREHPATLGLWATYGVLSLRKNDPGAAALDFEKELALHPEAVGVYNPLVLTLLQLKRRPEALTTLRAWSAAAPGDPRPVELQVNLLLDEGEAQAALQAGTAGLAHLPEGARADPQLQYALGTAELQAGAKGAGAKRLVTLLPATDELSLRNSIAYALADAGVELPAAEATERALLEQLSLQSEGWSLAAGPEPLPWARRCSWRRGTPWGGSCSTKASLPKRSPLCALPGATSRTTS